MKVFTEQEVLRLVTDELRQVNRALKIGGDIALTETDFQYIGTIMCALKDKKPSLPLVAIEPYDEMNIGI